MEGRWNDHRNSWRARRETCLVALKWVIEQDIIAGAIVGTRNIERLKENIEAVEISLPREYIDRLNMVSLEF